MELSYLDNGLLAGETRYNALGGPTAPIGHTTLLYDAANRVTALNSYDGSNVSLASYAYSWDNGSRLTSETDNTVVRTYSYDNANELLADGTNTYTFDGTGNRNNGSWSTPTGNENELQSDGTWSYSYDNEGNLTKKTKGASADTWVYGYDQRNQMTSAKEYDKDPGSGGVLQQEVDFKYDWWGNRIEKDVTVGSTTTVQRYALDGWDPAKPRPVGTENFDVFADLDGSSSLTTRYMHGDVVDQLFARVAADGTGAWLLTDHLGSVVGVTDNNGVLKDTIAYDGYGNIASESASSWGGLYKWTGRQYDPEEKLQYNRGRYFDAATARWTSQDPLGFGAGDSNLYRYVQNNLLGVADASGLQLMSRREERDPFLFGNRRERLEAPNGKYLPPLLPIEDVDTPVFTATGVEYDGRRVTSRRVKDPFIRVMDGKDTIEGEVRVSTSTRTKVGGQPVPKQSNQILVQFLVTSAKAQRPASKFHWLQFVSRHLVDEHGDEVQSGSFFTAESAQFGRMYIKRSQITVDARGSDYNVYYDGAGPLRRSHEVSVLDLPTFAPFILRDAKKEVFAADAYLVYDDRQVLYHVHWELIQEYDADRNAKGVPRYANVEGSPADRLPRYAVGSMLFVGYKKSDAESMNDANSIYVRNPIPSSIRANWDTRREAQR
jgi:RHS repeat-associated protein